MKDYSGFACVELARVFDKYKDSSLDIIASRIGMDQRDLKKIVVSKKTQFTGLGMADRILMGIHQNVSDLVRTGELTPIPASPNAARKMAEDEFWLSSASYSETDIDRRAQELLDLREEILSVV